jgi:inhibitor of Bruton tyrosine kinase
LLQLHEALYNTNLGAAVLLMQAGALVSPANKGSPTPLDVATERCNAFRRALHDDSRTTASTQSNCVTASAVFAFGKDNHQLGFATRGHSGVQFKPKLLTSLPPRVHITALAVSKQHCVAVTSEGDVLSWGCGEFGVLGHGSEANVLFPQRIAALRRKEVKSVAVSQHHSVAMSADGSLYTWGVLGPAEACTLSS